MNIDKKVCKIEDMTSLGKNINEIVKNIEEKFNTYETIEIEGFGVINFEEKKLALKAMKLIVQTNSKLWSRSGKKKTLVNKEIKNRRKSLTKEQEEEVVYMAQQGFKRADIASKFGVSAVTISRVLKSNNIKLDAGRPKLIV